MSSILLLLARVLVSIFSNGFTDLDATLPDGSRLQLTLATVGQEKGHIVYHQEIP